MTILNFIKEYWTQIIFLGTLIIGLITYGKTTINATKCSLRNDILDIFEKAEGRGNKIKRMELDAIKHSAELYFKLKGNSFVKNIVERVDRFEIID